MVNKFNNRIYIGLILSVILFSSYFFEVSYFFFIPISCIIFFELYDNKLINRLIFAITLFLFFLVTLYQEIFYTLLSNKPFIFLIIFLILIYISLSNFNNYLKFISLNIVVFMSLIFFLFSFIYHKNIFFIIILVASINDISAYFIGRKFKGPKILPKISPNKTWSGTLSSLIISSVILISLNFYFLYALLISLIFFFGDLYFSYFKRLINIKDYSKILLGHGGLLDRLDSSLIAITINLFYLLIFIK